MSQVGLFARLLGYIPEAQACAEYQAVLQSAQGEDFSDLDSLGFLQVHGHDRWGCPVVYLAAKLFPAQVVPLDRLLRYLCARLDGVQQEPWVAVLLHTQAAYAANCPGTNWLWRTWERLPCQYRDNLQRVHVVHCDLSLWAAAAAGLPLWRGGLWRKINWVSRVEFLTEHIHKASLLPLPGYVLEHDAELEEQPLADYGVVVASRELAAAVPGCPLPPC